MVRDEEAEVAGPYEVHVSGIANENIVINFPCVVLYLTIIIRRLLCLCIKGGTTRSKEIWFRIYRITSLTMNY